MNLDVARTTFLAEASELLERMESALLACEQQQADAETINDLFRAAHTIKGSAGLVGFDEVVKFTHSVETALDQVRRGQLAIGPELVSLLLQCKDHIGTLIGKPQDLSEDLQSQLSEAGGALSARLQSLTHSADPASPAVATSAPADSSDSGPTPSQKVAAQRPVASGTWHVSARFGPDVLRNGMDPIAIIHYLATFVEITGLQVLAETLPGPEAMNAETCYLGFEISLRTDVDKGRIESAFEFVREDCRLRILPPRSHIGDYVALIREHPDADARLGELLVACGTLTTSELQEALHAQAVESPENAKPLGEILIERNMVHAPVVDAALAKQVRQSDRHAPAQDNSSIRIQTSKLDGLIDLIAELAITGASTSLLAQRAGLIDLRESSFRLGRLVGAIRDSALKLRMVQIGTTFSRFHRVVRDVAGQLGKDIQLQTSGADTELDKTLVELISDPLLHLVRNAIDHGIEAPDVRVANNKPPRGTLKLSAFQESGGIAIEVSDDGRGINRARVLAKARERGLVAEGVTPADHDIINLITEAGFSTAEVVTDLSGRGVGMDVVKRNIEALRGSLDIESHEGQGTVFRIRLPLTLAIIDGFLLRVCGAPFVVPLDFVEECVDLQEIPNQGYFELRGNALPLLRLRSVFDLSGARARRSGIVVVRAGGKRIGLVVDTFVGKIQTVMKPLSPLFEGLKGAAGCTVLGDGSIALILDVPVLIGGAELDDGAGTTLAPVVPPGLIPDNASSAEPLT